MSHRSLLLVVGVALIFALGLLMVFNTSSAEILDRDLGGSTHKAVYKQLTYLAMGMGALFFIRRIGYPQLLELSWLGLILVSLALLLVFVPGVGIQVNGAHRWIRILGQAFQPSEFAKLIVPLFVIQQLLAGRPLFKTLAFAAIPIGLVLLEPDNGTTGILGLSLLAVCLLTGIKARYWLLPMLLFAIVVGAVATQLPYVSSRLAVFANPELDLLGRGHQPYQAKIATGSGGLLGRGVGASMQKFTYLPEAQNDYIAAIYAEEFGFVGISALILLYMGIATLGFVIAGRARDRAGFCTAALLAFLLSVQAFLNLGVVSGLVPSTGLNLPFFSQGGSSLIANIIAIGLLLDVDAKGVSEKFGGSRFCQISIPRKGRT